MAIDAPAFLDPVLKEAALKSYELTLKQHMDLIFWSNFWSGIVTSMFFGVVSYFGFRRNDKVESNSITEAVFNLLRAIVLRITSKGKK